jgi:hypothetical protein
MGAGFRIRPDRLPADPADFGDERAGDGKVPGTAVRRRVVPSPRPPSNQNGPPVETWSGANPNDGCIQCRSDVCCGALPESKRPGMITPGWRIAKPCDSTRTYIVVET